METSCVVIELLPNSVEKVKEWAEFLCTHRDEALESLKNEGVTVETAFVVNIEGKDYLIGYMRATKMSKVHEVVKDSTLNIDAYHQAFKKSCWGNRYKGTPVSDLSRIPNEAGYA
jgi:Family of unknown function (DUF6176)